MRLRDRGTALGMVCTIVAGAFTGCGIIPREEEYNTAAFVNEYEGEEFSMATVKRGDVRDYKKIECEYRESNIQDVELDDWVMIKKINVSAGDRVKEGDVLAELYSEEMDTNIEEVTYQINLKKAQIRQAKDMEKLEVKKQKLELDDETAIRAIRENYDADITRYSSELDSLELQYKSLSEDMKDYQICAQFDGTVTYVNTDLIMVNPWERMGGNGPGGDKSSTKNKVVSITDGSEPYFVASGDSSDYISKLSEGDHIKVSDGDEKYDTTVHFADDKVYFLLDFQPADITNGSMASAEYVIEEKLDVLYLPDSAVNHMGDEYVVYYEDENGLRNVKPVKVGLIAGNRAEITEGLEYGESVIIR